jgi:hypothetical protein
MVSDALKRRLIACSVAAVFGSVIGLTDAGAWSVYAALIVSLGLYIWLYDRAYKRGEIPRSSGTPASKA